MQNNIVSAFRQRLKRAGYTYISIIHLYDDEYVVYFCDHFGYYHRRFMTLNQISGTYDYFDIY